MKAAHLARATASLSALAFFFVVEWVDVAGIVDAHPLGPPRPPDAVGEKPPTAWWAPNGWLTEAGAAYIAVQFLDRPADKDSDPGAREGDG